VVSPGVQAPISIRRRVKRMVKAILLSLSGTAALVIDLACRLSGRRAGAVLVYHRIGSASSSSEPELIPSLTVERFESHIARLDASYEIVPPSEILDAVRSRRRGQRFPLAITFDDDVPHHVRNAMPALRRQGVNGAFFLCGASLEQPFGFWWERLFRVWGNGGLEESLRAELTPVGVRAPVDNIDLLQEAIEELPPGRRHALADRLGELAGPDPDDSGLRAEDVRRLIEGGMEVGFHTVRHDILTGLEDEALAAAMRDGRAEVEEAAGGPLRTIAYPNGRADRRVADAAREAGFELGFTAFGRAVDPEGDPLLVDRIDARFQHAGVLAYRVARALWRSPR
jgi:peptidoglycan/xylan/chitin deacetylase (PgdA/CDA1 family)